MVQLCRPTGCRLGLVTNGERWMLVDAPVGAVTTFASWYARIWSQEPITLQAFVHLLGIRRFFVDEADQLPALFDRSLKYQDEVTDALGEQVRRAVEVLIQALDKADQDRNRELLRDVKEPDALRGRADGDDAAGLPALRRGARPAALGRRTLRGQLRALDAAHAVARRIRRRFWTRRWDAWSRLLAVFRAVFGGIEHENLRLPALGGSLFDPDRFPFLEGRAKGTRLAHRHRPNRCRSTTAPCCCCSRPSSTSRGERCPIARWTSNRSATSTRACWSAPSSATAEVTLELDGTKNAKAPWVTLAELESARLDGAERLLSCFRNAQAVPPAACATIWPSRVERHA